MTNVSGFNRISLVDSQSIELPPEIDKLPVCTIVDHHKVQVVPKSEFVDVREDSGSTCSIYAEYLAAGSLELDRENPLCAKMASALLYGIRSDTDDYLLAREIDYRGASFLAPYADHELLLTISLQNISPRTMEVTRQSACGDYYCCNDNEVCNTAMDFGLDYCSATSCPAGETMCSGIVNDYVKTICCPEGTCVASTTGGATCTNTWPYSVPVIEPDNPVEEEDEGEGNDQSFSQEEHCSETDKKCLMHLK